MKKLLYGFTIGSFAMWCFNKYCQSDSPYDWLLTLVDKPFFQTHGMCLILAFIIAGLAYILPQKLVDSYYKACQNLVQNSISKSDKILQKALKEQQRRQRT
ncbi:MAG: hypothetical protein IJ587_09105 [Synergistaceae bacterium]|nr:hypothetical protein [Synergistaceae bacterium]